MVYLQGGTGFTFRNGYQFHQLSSHIEGMNIDALRERLCKVEVQKLRGRIRPNRQLKIGSTQNIAYRCQETDFWLMKALCDVMVAVGCGEDDRLAYGVGHVHALRRSVGAAFGGKNLIAKLLCRDMH